MDLQDVSGRLRKLSPPQEKVIRLYFGLGCERPHSAREMAQEFGVSAQVIAGILGAAQRRLAQEGLTSSDLREAARCESELRHSPRSLMESMSEFRRDRHWHRRF
jgi:DNA-directed RNA polymerase sigma subunit (sigma70/sigma32)